MDDVTRTRLNLLNRVFYTTAVDNFDESRGRFWPGWDRVWEFLSSYPPTDPNKPYRVLDLGCGNGRFGRFLAKRQAASERDRTLDYQIDYHGLDSNTMLLERAAADLQGLDRLHVTLEARDLVESPPPTGDYDLVVLFGIVHHIPGRDFRRQWIEQVAARVARGGLLVLTAWCFAEYDRWLDRTVPFPPDLTPEHGDFLLDWRRGHAINSVLRYCHYVDEAEQTDLAAATGLTTIATFRADGHTNDINRYTILHRDLV